ncbi:hypothetical protein BpHYR1_001450 [Brachionus plicatilis]|uniref:Uncharacterized protein n=1 Tax=Brachionus plicatilis TaxID=10195 RepID=A0A3M7T439_BRAPC|nr:hypothetical protein BpHYR1_001450 [Brachionus plicatilis]
MSSSLDAFGRSSEKLFCFFGSGRSSSSELTSKAFLKRRRFSIRKSVEVCLWFNSNSIPRLPKFSGRTL